MNNPAQNWSVIQILKKSTEFLKTKNIENSRLNAEKILCKVLNVDRVNLYLQFDKILNKHEIDLSREYLRRRGLNEPLQYILGETEFMGLPLTITPAVLIPRPETEILVEKILDLNNGTENQKPYIWDIGTGSGCIAISIAVKWPEAHILATDVSSDALVIARKNAIRHNVHDRIKFVEHDVLTEKLPAEKDIDILISNPPYVDYFEYGELNPEIRDFEPDIAITDFKDGLTFYKKVLSLIEIMPKCKFVIIELTATKKEEIYQLFSKKSFKNMEIIPDLNNLPRILFIEI